MYSNIKSQAHVPIKYDPPTEVEEDDEDVRTIFCANIDQRVTEEILYEVFLQAGPIESVRIPKDGGRQKTFGFITYVHKCSVPYALHLLAGLSLFKKCLTIKVRQMPGGGGGSVVNQQDNFAFRANIYPTHKEENPFRRDISPPMGADWASSRRNDESKKNTLHKPDNFALRGTSHQTHKEENPFRSDISSPIGAEWASSRRNDESKKNKQDNSALRGGSNLSSHCEENPFKRDVSPPRAADWTPSRRNDELKKHSSQNSRQHQTTPYSRAGSKGKDGGGRQNHSRHGGRSNQRNRQR